MKKLFMMAFAVISAMTLTVSCDSDYAPDSFLQEATVSCSYVGLDINGGSSTIDLNTNSAWEISNDLSWLTISPMSGTGASKITFSADGTIDGRNGQISINVGDKTQYINVVQGVSKISEATCAEVIAGPDSKTYQTKGVVTSIANTEYGNFYINDGTGEVYIYGTLYAGKTKNDPIKNNNIEVGDEVTVQGPKTTYGSTVELVDVTVVKVKKSLIKCDSTYVAGVLSSELPIEGGEIIAFCSNKGNGIFVEIPADAQSWLSIAKIAGNNITFKAQPNEGGDRSTTIVLKTTDGKNESSAQFVISQKGAVVALSVKEFLAQEDGNSQYRLYATISNVKDEKNVYVRDFSGEVLLYKPNFNGASYKVGDIISVVGKHGSYKGNAQMTSAVVEEVKSVDEISLKDFKALADNKEKFYLISGKVAKSTEPNTKYDLDTYGNFSLVAEDGTEVYVYGVSTGVGGEAKKFGTLGVKEGDTLTVIAYKTSYTKEGYTINQAGGAMYFSHKSAE